MADAFKLFALNQQQELITLGQMAGGMSGFGMQPPQQSPVAVQPGPGFTPPPAAPFGQGFVPPTAAAAPPPQSPGPPPAGMPTELFANLEKQQGLPPGTLMHLYGLESSYGKNLANPSSSARGPFQFINSTARQYGLTPETVMQLEPSATAAAQMAAAAVPTLTKVLGRAPTKGEIYLAHQQGLGGAVGLLSNPDAKASDIVGHAAVVQNGGDDSMTAGEFASIWTNKEPGKATASSRDVPSSRDEDLEREEREALADLSPEAKKKRARGAMFTAIGKGLSQMSQGETVDITSVLDDYLDRQEEMRRRVSEIYRERRRQTERGEDIDIRAGERAEDRAVRVSELNRLEAERRAAEERAETRDISGEQRVVNREVAERERLSAVAKTAIPLMFPAADANVAGSVAAIDGPLATKWAEAEQTKADTLADEEKLRAQNQPIADFMIANDHPEFAELALTDPDKAFTQFEKITGQTGIMKEAQLLLDPTTPAAQALARRLKLENYAGDERLTASAVSQDKLLTEAEQRVNDARAFDRQLEFAGELVLDTEQGFMSNVMLLPDKFFADLGVDRDGVSQRTLFDAMSKRATAGVLAAENKGAASDKDTQFFQESLPALGNTKEANAAISYANRELHRREKIYTEAWREFYISSDKWYDATARQEFIDQKLSEADATGEILTRVSSMETAEASVPMGQPYIIEGDDGTVLVIRGEE